MSSNKRKEMSASTEAKDKKEEGKRTDDVKDYSSSDDDSDNDALSTVTRHKKLRQIDMITALRDELVLLQQLDDKSVLILVQGFQWYDSKLFRVPVKVLFKDLKVQDIIDLGDPDATIKPSAMRIARDTILTDEYKLPYSLLVPMHYDTALLSWYDLRP